MIQVHFTSHLEIYFKDLKSLAIDASSVKEALVKVNIIYPGIIDYFLDETGRLRKHVKIYINEEFIQDEEFQSDKLVSGDQMYFMQALSGG